MAAKGTTQHTESITEQFNCPPTSPWTEWAEAFVRQMTANGSSPNSHNRHHPPGQNGSARTAPGDDALMDCYNS